MASRNISGGNTAIRNSGFARNALKVTLFSLITRLISRLVAPEAILVTVAVSFPGWRVSLNTKMLAPFDEFNLSCRRSCNLQQPAPLGRLQALVLQAMPTLASPHCMDCRLQNQRSLFSCTSVCLVQTISANICNTILNFNFYLHQPLTRGIQMRSTLHI